MSITLCEPILSLVASLTPQRRSNDGPVEMSLVQGPVQAQLRMVRNRRSTMAAGNGQKWPERGLHGLPSGKETKSYKTIDSHSGSARKELSEVSSSWRQCKRSWSKHCKKMIGLFEKIRPTRRANEQGYVKQRQEALTRLETIKTKRKDMHEKVTAPQVEATEMSDAGEEEPEPAEPTIQVKQLKTAIQEVKKHVLAESRRRTSPTSRQTRRRIFARLYCQTAFGAAGSAEQKSEMA